MSETAAPLVVGQQLDGARLLVVGGTGFLGKVWLALLLHRYPQVGRVVLVVRGKKDRDPEARFWTEIASSRPFDALREEHPGAAYEEFLRARVEPIEADVSKPLCGLDAARVRELAGTIDAVVNVAGVVDFNPPLDEALLANAFGVQNLVELARALGDVPVLHTSTCYVAGYRSGAIDEVDPREQPFPNAGKLESVHWDPAREISECLDLVAQARHRADDSFRMSTFLSEARKNLESRGEPTQGSALEAELARVRRKFLEEKLVAAGDERARHWGWTNIYTYTKSIGEQILANSGLPFTIVRPAVIESSLAYPFPGWNEGINTMAPLTFLFMKGHIQVPAGERTVLDVIPVDLVSSAMIAALAALLEGKAKTVYQVGSSDSNPLTMHRLIELCGLYKRKHFQRGGRINPFADFLQAHLEPIPVSTEAFHRHGAPAISRVAKSVSKVLAQVAVGPAASLVKPVSKALNSYGDLARRNADIWELFIPFMAGTEYYFSTTNTRGLYQRMTAEDRALIPFAPEAMDWRHYMQEVHLPGLEKWVLPEIDEKISRPVKALRAHDSLWALLDDAVEKHDLAVALSRFEEAGFTRITYRDWKSRAEAAAARLAELGVREGDRVMLCAQNHPDWPIAYFGVVRAGAVVVPVDSAMEPAPLANIARASQAKLLIGDAPSILRAGQGDASLRTVDLHALTERGELTPPPMPALTTESLASVIYTSGTTGTPKGVMLTHGNFTSLIASLAPVFPLGPRDRAVSVLPLHHTFEFTCGMLLPLSRGTRVSYLDELTSERLAQAMKASRVTAMVGVPALWQLLERRIWSEVRERGPVVSQVFDWALQLNRMVGRTLGADVGRVLFGSVHSGLGGNIRFLISGGAALPKATAELFQGLGIELTEGYGLTEAAPVLTVAKGGPGAKLGNVGKPIPGVEVRIDTPDAQGVGQVLARGPNVMKGYADNEAETARTVDSKGWLHTGDLGSLDKKGRLTLVGRSKDVIVSASGENVYPDDVERSLGEIAHVSEVCLVGIPDPQGGERVACVAVPSRDGAPEEGDPHATAQWRLQRREQAMRALKDALANLPRNQQPAVTLLYDVELPRTATRKVKRHEVRAIVERLVAAGAAPAVGARRGGSASGPVRAALAALTRRDVASITAETRLRGDLGVDSLMAMELSVALEAALDGRKLPDELSSVETVGELEALIGVEQAPSTALAVRESDEEQAPRGMRIPGLPSALRELAKAGSSLVQREFYGTVMKPKVTGRAFLPHNRNTIVVANHVSHLDMGFVKYALGSYGRELVALAARDYFFDRGEGRRFFIENFTNLAPIDRNAGLRQTLREMGQLLEAGKTVLIFPEGTRSPDGQLREFKGAIGHLALRYQTDILPVYLGGTYEAMPKKSRVPRKRELLARIGPPLCVADLERLTAGQRSIEATRNVAHLAQRAVEALRDGTVLDLSRLRPEDLVQADKRHPLEKLFDELEKRFVPGAVSAPVSFYFTLGNDSESKWTVRVQPDTVEVRKGKPEGGQADCVLKTNVELFTRIVREGYTPEPSEFMLGAIKSNDLGLLQTFQRVFALTDA